MAEFNKTLNDNISDDEEKRKHITELQNRIDSELDKGENADFDLVDRLTSEIIELEGINTEHNAEEMKKNIIKKNQPSKKPRRIALRMLAAVMAVVIILTGLNIFTVSAYSSNVFDAIITIIDKGAVKLGFKEENDADDYKTKYYDADKLANFVYKEIDVIPPLPADLGEGFIQKELSVTGDDVKIIYASYSLDDILFSISIKNEPRDESINGNYVETVEVNNLKLYLTKDDKYYNIFFEYEKSTIKFATNMEYDELIKVLNTIV